MCICQRLQVLQTNAVVLEAEDKRVVTVLFHFIASMSVFPCDPKLTNTNIFHDSVAKLKTTVTALLTFTLTTTWTSTSAVSGNKASGAICIQ